MNALKNATALIGCFCLLCRAPIAAQTGVGLLADSARLHYTQAGQPFPYARGISMDLSMYRQVRLAGLLADTVIFSKNRRIDALGAQLETARQLYANCTGARREAEAATDRQAAALATLTATYKNAQAAATTGAGILPWIPKLVGTLLVGLAAGTVYGIYISP